MKTRVLLWDGGDLNPVSYIASISAECISVVFMYLGQDLPLLGRVSQLSNKKVTYVH